MSTGRYPKFSDYEGFEIDPKEETIRFACCDCGLVHDMGVAIVGRKKVQIAYHRHNRATAQLRRHSYDYLQQKPSRGKWRMSHADNG